MQTQGVDQISAQTSPVSEAKPGVKHAYLEGPRHLELLKDEVLAEIFAATVLREPDSIAMMSPDGETLTYSEVSARAEAIAAGLVAQGACAGKVIGLWMARGTALLIGQIAITRTGAAWLPFDADAPIERIAACLGDAQAIGMLTCQPNAQKCENALPCPAWTSQAMVEAGQGKTLPSVRALGAGSQQPAYMIYTSGSTGIPKGIVISQANICHYLRSANEVYGMSPQDIVFQGASVAFDLSMEEIWIPYLVGARLFVATPALMGETEKLPDILDAAGITVLDTVPTLLALLGRDVPSLRIIIMGGEAFPPALAQLWCRLGRTLFNSYGPTEATVVATCSIVRPGEAVTIGRPIPNYTCYVVDEAGNLLPEGAEGELWIGGPGVALGYLKRPQLTAEKFVTNPFNSSPDLIDPVLYRSGDAVLVDEEGNIAFRGRIDDQVKIRGFRVELGEIESRLTDLPSIQQAAVVLRNDQGVDELVAFVVPARGALIDAKQLRMALRQTLPAYMVPGRFEEQVELPRLSSGKVNRNQLKKQPLMAVAPLEAQREPETETEEILLNAMKKVLPPQAISFDADFFTDLGGHSLLAARFVSLVRQSPRLVGITLQDVYNARSLSAMAELMDRKFPDAAIERDLSFEPPPLYRRFFCGLGQAIVLPFILALVNAQWLSVFISYILINDAEASLFQEILSLLVIYTAVSILSILIAVLAKWVLIGRTKPGRYPLWGSYFFRWWVVQRMIGLLHLKWYQASPMMAWILWAFGADIGRDCIIGEINPGALDLVRIGRGSSLGSKIVMANARVEGNELIIGSIDIGEDCYIGTSCVFQEDIVVADHAELADLTSLPAGSRIGFCEKWDGSPARKVGMVDLEALPAHPLIGGVYRSILSFGYVLMLVLIPPLSLLPIFPAFFILDKLDDWSGFISDDRRVFLLLIPFQAWPTSFFMVILTVLFIAACRWVILPRVKEGDYSIYSWFYFRKWAVSLTTEITLDVLSSLYATIYMRSWYRLMGAKIGKGAEISTNLSGRYDLVEIGEKCFIADEVVLGDEEIRRGWMSLKKVQTGPRVFIGNDGVVPPGAVIPEGALIGIKSKPPANELIQAGDTWFGSPPIKLPVRQRFDGGGAAWTYEPPKWKKLARALFEAAHISLPTMLFITFGSWAEEAFGDSLLKHKYHLVFMHFIIASVLISLALAAVVIVIKWLTMGRYEPVVKPMWSWWAMRTESVAVMYWGMAGKVLLDHLRGTPFLPWILRLFGVKIGRGVYMDMTDITEFDCVTIGDYSVLNTMSALQTHLYEDRVMKVGRVVVGKGVTVGPGSTVLYDTHVGDYARLGPLTLVMKGESIPEHSHWVGAPAEPMVAVLPAPTSSSALPTAA